MTSLSTFQPAPPSGLMMLTLAASARRRVSAVFCGSFAALRSQFFILCGSFFFNLFTEAKF